MDRAPQSYQPVAAFSNEVVRGALHVNILLGKSELGSDKSEPRRNFFGHLMQLRHDMNRGKLVLLRSYHLLRNLVNLLP